MIFLVEMYNGLNRGERFDVQRMRYRGGVVLPLFSDCWESGRLLLPSVGE